MATVRHSRKVTARKNQAEASTQKKENANNKVYYNHDNLLEGISFDGIWHTREYSANGETWTRLETGSVSLPVHATLREFAERVKRKPTWAMLLFRGWNRGKSGRYYGNWLVQYHDTPTEESR